MRLLITGGAGCLGSNLIERYLPHGHDICVIDNFATGKQKAIPEQPGLEVIEGTVADAHLIEKTMERFRPSHVIHSAASYKDPDNWVEDAATNVTGAINIVRACENNNVERLINFQTALCYGRPTTVPISIDHPTAPFTSYGISKTAGEAYILQSSVPAVSLRLANICAPRLAIGPIPTFYKRLKEGKDCFCSDSVRDFLDINDFFSLMDRILTEEFATGVYNVSSGMGHSIHEVFEAVCTYLEISTPDVPILPVGDDDVREVVLDPAKTHEAFDWQAKVSFTETIHNQLRWYDKFGVNDVYSHLQQPAENGTNTP